MSDSDIQDFLVKDLKLERFQRQSSGGFSLHPLYAKNEDEDGRMEEEMYLVDFDQELAKEIVTKGQQISGKGKKKTLGVEFLSALPDYVKFDQPRPRHLSPSNRYDSRDGGRLFDGDRRDWNRNHSQSNFRRGDNNNGSRRNWDRGSSSSPRRFASRV